MDKKAILFEAIRIEQELAELKAPNSPMGTHYIAQISPAFVYSANTKDMDELLNTLKIKDASISSFKPECNRPGMFVLTKEKHELVQLKNGTSTFYLLRGRSGGVALLTRRIVSVPNVVDPSPYIVAWNFMRQRNRCDWGQGHYVGHLRDAVNMYTDYISQGKQ